MPDSSSPRRSLRTPAWRSHHPHRNQPVQQTRQLSQSVSSTPPVEPANSASAETLGHLCQLRRAMIADSVTPQWMWSAPFWLRHRSPPRSCRGGFQVRPRTLPDFRTCQRRTLTKTLTSGPATASPARRTGLWSQDVGGSASGRLAWLWRSLALVFLCRWRRHPHCLRPQQRHSEGERVRQGFDDAGVRLGGIWWLLPVLLLIGATVTPAQVAAWCRAGHCSVWTVAASACSTPSPCASSSRAFTSSSSGSASSAAAMASRLYSGSPSAVQRSGFGR